MNDTQVSGLSNWKFPPTENGNNGGGVDLRLDDEFKENQVEASLGWISRNAQYVADYGTQSRKKFWNGDLGL